jgi:hypothetical protein
MTNWNGTILGPPHVRIIRKDMMGIVAKEPFTERTRESDIQCQHSVRTRIPRFTTYPTLCVQNQPALR